MSEGIKAFANYEWAWDNLPQEVQDALNADWIALEEAKALVVEANNSLYGSQGYFHYLNGGAFDKYHLATGIEALKFSSRRAHTSQARLSEAVKVLEEIAQMPGVNGGHYDIGEEFRNTQSLRLNEQCRVLAKWFLATLGEDT